MEYYEAERTQKVSKGRKVLAAFGILFVAVGIFLATLAFSFKILMLPEKSEAEFNSASEAEKMELEIMQLEEENTRLREENEILKSGAAGRSSTGSGLRSTADSDED